MASVTHLGICLALALVLSPPAWADALRFNRDIRPILADNCFNCHGFDSGSRKGGLRLDQRDAALRGGKSGEPALVPGQPDASALLKRILTHDEDDLMPPPKTGRKVTAAQVETLRQWIRDGADYQPHWAFMRVERPPAPGTGDAQPLDAFVRDRLLREKVLPSAAADPSTLIRRLSLDLNGLPPTPDEVAAFVRDPSPAAYRAVVDRLLASPRYGEHFAAQWLDLARFADSHGFQEDNFRTMWRWRDWVIDAYNRNQPFDQFTIEQIAGDLLPEATTEQRIATGFNRNHRINNEFGSVDEEWKVEYVVDRVETTAATWLGLTMGCARCHDHKYDPVSQREFYQFFAYFNNVPERGVFWDHRDPTIEPAMPAPLPADQERLRAFDRKVAEAEAELTHVGNSLDSAQAAWESTTTQWINAVPEPPGLIASYDFEGTLDGRFGRRTTVTTNATIRTHEWADGRSTVTTNTSMTTNSVSFADRMRLGGTTNFIAGVFGLARQGSESDGLTLNGWLQEPTAEKHDFTVALWIRPESDRGTLLRKMVPDGVYQRGVELALTNGRLALTVWGKPHVDSSVPIELIAADPLPTNTWSHVAVSFDGQRRLRGPVLLVNGVALATEPLRPINRGLGDLRSEGTTTLGAFAGAMDDLRFYERALSDLEVSLLARRHLLAGFGTPPANRSADLRKALAGFYRDFVSPAYAAARAALDTRVRERDEFVRQLPWTMIMAERPTAPVAHVLFRGQYDQKRDPVGAGLPAALPPLANGSPNNRLGLARWLVSRDNPLTSRVVVNRLWERFFGTGIVKTADNFGIQAEPPSDPELLDWLAAEFMEPATPGARPWDIQHIIRRIVLSDTYRQSSVVTPAQLERDPENRLLARGPRFRLPAEALRDQALAISGLLAEQVGGPSARPYQPDNVWRANSTYGNMVNYQRDTGPGLYRRSLYTVWKRSSGPPSLMLFDAPGREACAVKRPRTNTPLQALSLLNEITFVEAARKLAERMIRSDAEPARRLRHGFLLATAREPSRAEITALQHALDRQLILFRADRPAAEQLLAQGESRSDASLDPAELAGYTQLGSILLNLDETVTRE
jgi:hypothetical protein